MNDPTLVTDPALIARLDAMASQENSSPGNNDPTLVTDPALIARLDSMAATDQNQPNSVSSSPSLRSSIFSGLTRAAQDIDIGGANFDKGIINFPNNLVSTLGAPNFANKYLPANNINYSDVYGMPNPTGVDKVAQSIAQFLPYGNIGVERAAAPILGSTAEEVPNLLSSIWNGISGFGSKVANKIPGAALDSATQGLAFGTTQNTNPISGGVEGTALGGATGAIPAIASSLANATKYIRPQALMNQILNSLGGGQSIENNAQSLAQDVKNAYQGRLGEARDLYNPVFSNLGDRSIINGGDGAQEISSTPSEYSSLDPDITASYDRNLKKVHQTFVNDPTLQNAHDLQSQLGSSIRDLESGSVDAATRNVIQGYGEAQGAIKNDINNFLQSTDPASFNQYQLATQNYRQNVVPYLQDKNISQLSKGDITNPDNVGNIFKSPEPSTVKVVNDLGQNGVNKILYSQLGKATTPEKFIGIAKNLNNNGLNSYVNPDLTSQISQLQQYTTNRNIAQRLIGGAAGATGIHFLGEGALPAAFELMGPLAGIVGGKWASNLVKKTLPGNAINSINSGITNSSKAAYGPVSKAILATLLAQGAQQ